MRYDDDRKSVLVRIIELLNFFRGPGDYFRVMLWRPMVNINLGDVNLSPRALSTDEAAGSEAGDTAGKPLRAQSSNLAWCRTVRQLRATLLNKGDRLGDT